MKEQIKHWYNTGRWSVDRVHNVVGKPSGITEEEYKEITECTYPDKE